MSRSLRIAEPVVIVARSLGALADEVAFLGGAIVESLLTDPAAPTPRFTRDVDLIIEVGTRQEYWRMQRALRERGFVEDDEDGVICRWIVEGIKVDVMPTEEQILGFSNRWYSPAIREAQRFESAGIAVRLITAPYFVATKLEAFSSRGRSDVWSSHDVCDLVVLADGRPELTDEIRASSMELKAFIASSLTRLFDELGLDDAVSGHLPPDPASQQRHELVVKRLRELTHVV